MSCRAWSMVSALIVGTLVAAGTLAEEHEGAFIRVMVPADRLDDVPFDGRYVPMPLSEFDRAVGRLSGPGMLPSAVADVSRYRLTIDDRGRLDGTVEFTVGSTAVGLARSMSLGSVDASDGRMVTAEGLGEAVIFGQRGRRVAIATPQPGTYRCAITCPPAFDGGSDYRLPLVAATSTVVEMRLAEGLSPVVTGPVGVGWLAVPVDAEAGTWRIEVAAAEEVTIAVVGGDRQRPRLQVWNRVEVHGRHADVAARIVPDTAWADAEVELETDPGVAIIGARDSTDGAAIGVTKLDGGTAISVMLPSSLVGTTTPIDLDGTVEVKPASAVVVPTFRTGAERWAGGGAVVIVDPAFTVENVRVEECVVVSPTVAMRWPTPSRGRVAEDSPMLHLEHQSPLARAEISFNQRQPQLDTVRVTTVDLSPGAVVARAACDVRVTTGEAFAIVAEVQPGWFIDSVEAIDWQPGGSADNVADGAEELPGQAVADENRTIDWRVVRAGLVNELRIGLAEGATPIRSLGLRITGHRRGVPLGGEFATGDMDMVRLEGESAGTSLVDYRLGPDAVVEIDGEPIGIVQAEGRLAMLLEAGATRGRVRGGDRVTSRTARLARRRPPLATDVLVQVVARDARITESITVSCRPEAGSVDSLIVHFSEPLGDAVEWAMVEPAAATLFARRLEATEADRGDQGSSAGIRDSWLVEIRPAVEGNVTLRASRTQPFMAPSAVPLAWVEGATDAGGTLVVRGGGGTRPVVVNHRLSELPPMSAEGWAASAIVTELSYGEPDAVTEPGGEAPAAEVVPADMAEARAWVWHEVTRAWCHESGRTECDTSFDIENRGREEVTITAPEGLRIEELSIDGIATPFDGIAASGGTATVAIPAGNGRTRLVVRGVIDRTPAFGVWRLDPLACGIDVPVLDRQMELMLPPELDLVAGRSSAPDIGWTNRLLDASWKGEPGPAASLVGAESVGFHRVHVTSGKAGLIVVRRGLTSAATVLAGLLTAAFGWWRGRNRSVSAVGIVVVMGITALWADPPFLDVARAAWWGGWVGLWAAAGWSRRVRPVAAVGVLMGASMVATAATPDAMAAEAADPARVYITTGGEGEETAVVPEGLFRRLASGLDAEADSIRVKACRLVTTDETWRLELDLDVDQGGVMVLRQPEGGCRWERSAGGAAGLGVDVSPDGTEAKLLAAVSGSQRVTVELVPAGVRRGIVEMVEVVLPDAARAEVVAAAGPADRSSTVWECDRGDGDGIWNPVAATAGRFDVTRATRVRLARSVDPRHPLAAIIDESRSENLVAWRNHRCLVKASFEIQAGQGVVRSVVVRATPPLQPVGDDLERLVAKPLGSHRFLIDVPEPVAGRSRLDISFAMPLADPVGVFEAPAVWLESVRTDLRTVRCVTDGDLEITAELPRGSSMARPSETDDPGVVAVWRSEVMSSAESSASGSSRPRLAVRRRSQLPRMRQSLDVEFRSDHVGLAYVSQIDAESSPLTDMLVTLPGEAVVDRVTLSDVASSTPTPIDVSHSRVDPSTLSIVVQRPRLGRFRLEVVARLREPPPLRGSLPLMRAAWPATAGLEVRWSARDLSVTVSPAVGSEGRPDADFAPGVTTERELASDEPAPGYVLEERPLDPNDAPSTDAVALPPTSGLGDQVESTVVHLVIDPRGRLWGVVRFDVVTSSATMTLALPNGMRLFDVLIDGRETRAVPQSTGRWSLRLHDTGWPRSILAVFAGDAGGVTSGDALQLAPPRLVGLPCREVVWRIDTPTGTRLRVAEPAKLVSSATWNGSIENARQRVADVFEAAAAAAFSGTRERLLDFAEAVASGDRPVLEREWENAIRAGSGSSERVHVITAGDEPLTVRTVRLGSPEVRHRGAATLFLLAVLAIGWGLAARWPERFEAVLQEAWPWGLAAAGVLWVLVLEPALPGWGMVVGGVVAAMRGRPVARQPA